MSCSALRRSYRDILRLHAGPVRFLHLAGPAEVVRARVEARSDHYMPASLVDSQNPSAPTRTESPSPSTSR
jgi:carbohydrate kinase (thermoresistant glucokinase family)